MKSGKSSNRALICLAAYLLLAVPLVVRGQSMVDTANVLSIGENVVNNFSHLQPFYEKLYALKAGNTDQVNIIHIGDSHIQADFLTEVVRKQLQLMFGNAGRGLVVPGRVAGTNEPLNFVTHSTTKWNSKRIIHPAKPLPIGIGGITINTQEAGASFDLRMNDQTTDYSFNTVTLFYEQGRQNYGIAVRDSLFRELAVFPSDGTLDQGFATVTLPSYYRKINFQTLRQRDDQSQANLFGLSLENGKPGVLYHSIGVNGAKYEHYNSSDAFARQTKILRPDLIIISLGTNESVEYPNIRKTFSSEISRLVTSLQAVNPDAVFLLITPPDSFLRKVKTNPGIETIRMQIIEYAVENGIAFWDMFKVNGGKNSAAQWKMKGYLRPDGIHFSRDGYAYQGKLLFDAIMRGYDEYVSNRHP